MSDETIEAQFSSVVYVEPEISFKTVRMYEAYYKGLLEFQLDLSNNCYTRNKTFYEGRRILRRIKRLKDQLSERGEFKL